MLVYTDNSRTRMFASTTAFVTTTLGGTESTFLARLTPCFMCNGRGHLPSISSYAPVCGCCLGTGYQRV